MIALVRLGAAALAVAALVATAIPTATVAVAADGEARSMSTWPKPTRKVKSGEKLCRYKFPTGERAVWVCDKQVPCCAWDAINYVKCGTTFSGCL